MAEVAASVGALVVVVLPLTQLIVPPEARAAAGMATELPPVTPPVHPLTVMVVDAVPVIVVQVIDAAAHAGEASPTVATDAGTASAATAAAVNRIRLISNSPSILGHGSNVHRFRRPQR